MVGAGEVEEVSLLRLLLGGLGLLGVNGQALGLRRAQLEVAQLLAGGLHVLALRVRVLGGVVPGDILPGVPGVLRLVGVRQRLVVLRLGGGRPLLIAGVGVLVQFADQVPRLVVAFLAVHVVIFVPAGRNPLQGVREVLQPVHRQ